VLVQMRRRAFEHFFSNVAYTLFGILYLGLSTSLMLRLAMMPGADGYVNRGNQLLLVAITVVKLGDVAAYFGGRALGRHKMAPRISPGKTWEGFACSFIGAIGGAYLMQAVFAQLCAHPPFATWWEPIVWGAVLGPIGAAGDLAESCMKREASVKDSGDTLPGFIVGADCVCARRGGLTDVCSKASWGSPLPASSKPLSAYFFAAAPAGAALIGSVPGR
jgi:CDP-diglyceride synthetase